MTRDLLDLAVSNVSVTCKTLSMSELKMKRSYFNKHGYLASLRRQGVKVKLSRNCNNSRDFVRVSCDGEEV